MRVLTEEHKQKIPDLLEQQKIVKSQGLVDLLNVSESTIGRDLQELENGGLLEGVHGGAKKEQLLDFEQSISEKSLKDIHEKQQIAKLTAETINDEDVIYLDTSSTTLETTPLLQGRQITVMTNSIQHAANLVDLELATIILGGAIKLSTNTVLGSNTIERLKHFHFSKAFMRMNGAHIEQGFTTPDPEEAAVKRLTMKNSEGIFILIDHAKFSQLSFTSVAPLEAATIITRRCPLEFINEFHEETTVREAI